MNSYRICSHCVHIIKVLPHYMGDEFTRSCLICQEKEVVWEQGKRYMYHISK